MILFLAGLTNIPNELNDAARVEGAGSWIRFWRITFPLLSSYTFFIFIINIVDSLQSIDLVYIMTQGRPADSTNLIVYYIYQQAFRYWNMGVGSTLTSMLTQATESSPEWSLTMAATIIVVAPLLLTFIIFQKRFIQSFMHSGLKG